MWGELSVGKTLGYIGAHLIACLLAVSTIVMLIPYDGYLDREGLFFGVKKIYPNLDFMSVFTIELIGTLFLYLGFIYLREIEKNKDLAAVYYGTL